MNLKNSNIQKKHKFCHSCQRIKETNEFNIYFHKARKMWNVSMHCKECIIQIKEIKKRFFIKISRNGLWTLLPNFEYCTICKIIQNKNQFLKNGKRDCIKCRRNRHVIWEYKSGTHKKRYCILPNFRECKNCNFIKNINEFGTGRHRCTDCCKKIKETSNINNQLKFCKFCSEQKMIKNFCKDKREKNGISNECKICHNKRMKNYYLMYPNKAREKHTNYYKKNKNKIIEGQKKRIKNNPNIKMICRLRSLINGTLRSKKIIKSQRTEKLIGCSLNFFHKYFFSLFTNDMTITDFYKAKIHIGHIKPCCSFNLIDENQQKQCFHYINLRPEWEKDNYKKITEDRKLSINYKFRNGNCVKLLNA